MANYVSVSEINTVLGTSWEDTLIGVLNNSAESILNSLIGTTWLNSWDITEKINYPTFRNDFWMFPWRVLYVQWVNPTVVKSVDWVTLTSWDYEITWNKVFLKDTMNLQTDFPYKNTIIYTAWFTTIPNDIKQAIFLIVWALYNTKTSQNIDSFRQWELSINYSKDTVMNNIMDPESFSLLSSIINKYKVPLILSSWADRTSI